VTSLFKLTPLKSNLPLKPTVIKSSALPLGSLTGSALSQPKPLLNAKVCETFPAPLPVSRTVYKLS